MHYPHQNQIAWQFDTANFRVIFHTESCQDNPADMFQYQEDIDAVLEGRVEWFDAFVSVWYGSDEDDLRYVTHDALCCCAYNSIDEFIISHRDSDPMNRNCSIMRRVKGERVVICHYFPGMVTETVKEARKIVAQWQQVKLRAA